MSELRPRPVAVQDTAFYWQALKEGRLEIQRCAACGRLRHPPLPACPGCHSLEWDTIASTGRGVLETFTVIHAPEVPPFKVPYAVGLARLEEGTKLVAEIVDTPRDEIEIGMSVRVKLVVCDDDLTLPFLYRAAS
jgi:uncharacterized OB-fold protein